MPMLKLCQFLLGTVQLEKMYTSSMSQEMHVSIPLRYGTTQHPNETKDILEEMCQFLLGTVQLVLLSAREDLLVTVSIPLRYGTTRRHRVGC